MREEEETTWFARWEEQLPSPEELTPLSQSLITPDLALAFDITPIPSPNPHPNPLTHNQLTHHSFDPSDPAASSAGGSSGGHNGCGPDEPARTLKRPRLVWTPQLHKRFVDAVAHLGIKNAVPKTIMQLMSVDGLTRENVASHLQKYRLYLKRMQGIGTNGNGGSSPNGAPLSASEAATEQLFASGPVPHHFLTGRSPGPVHQQPDPYMPFVPSVQPVPSIHHHQMGYNQHQFYNQRSNGLGQYNGFDQQNGIFSRSVQMPPAQHHHRMIGPGGIGMMPGGSVYMDELERNGRGGAGQRRELTLFPTGDH